MKLGDEFIYDRNQLHRNFDIEKLYGENILLKPSAFISFSETLQSDLDLLIVTLLKSKLPFTPIWLSQSRINPEKLRLDLDRQAKRVYDDFLKNNWDTITTSLLGRCDTFCEEEARLLWILLLLHIQAKSDITASGIAYMTGLLDEKKKPECIKPDRRAKELTLPISNKWLFGVTHKMLLCDGLHLSVRLEETTQIRTLFYQETLSYFASGNQCLFFLPRNLDPQDHSACMRYCLAMQSAYASAPGKLSGMIAKPILNHRLKRAGYLLTDGRVYVGRKLLDVCALDAAADAEHIYLATTHGVDVISRKARKQISSIAFDCAIEEILIDSRTCAVSLRSSDHSFPIPIHSTSI